MLINRLDKPSELLYVYNSINDPDMIKWHALEGLENILNNEDFNVGFEDRKGTSLMRKFSVNVVLTRGMTMHDIDIQFNRNRNNIRLPQDTYACRTESSVDGIVAAVLCKDGPIHY